ncbi:MAG: hypothetical protein L6422_04915 [Candidatus Marinimicrobia bacterium]|nr:hypothetical protein [Candidatus Neomarinimicrobiota bacterium]MCG2715614.1 hypothetical protein [Candidatus Neomarinimicrobiota bacterium]
MRNLGVSFKNITDKIPQCFRRGSSFAKTRIRFEIPEASDKKLCIHDILSKGIDILASGKIAIGCHKIKWAGKDKAGNSVGSGLCICILQAPGFQQSKKMILLR